MRYIYEQVFAFIPSIFFFFFPPQINARSVIDMYMYSRNQEADPGYDVRNENPLYVKLVDINPRLHYDNEEKFRERKTLFFFSSPQNFKTRSFKNIYNVSSKSIR